MTELTQSYLKQILHYDPDTGVFTWIQQLGRAQIGCAAGHLRLDGYRHIRIHGRRYLAHRLAWFYICGTWPASDIDHRNGEKDDNRISNLRLATRSENGQNRRQAQSHSKSGLRGVSPCNKKRWRAQIKLNGRCRYLGIFPSKESAHHAYLKAKAVLHPFAEVNAL